MKFANFIRINGELYRMLDQTVDMERGVIVADITVGEPGPFEQEAQDALDRFLAKERGAEGWKKPAPTAALEQLRRDPPRILRGFPWQFE